MIKSLVKKSLRLFADTYERIANPYSNRPIQPAIPGWSFVVITAGTDNASLRKLCASVESELHNTPYEIILVGPKSLRLDELGTGLPLVHVHYKELRIPKVTGWITRKKNVGIRLAKYDKVAVCHDYIGLVPGWKDGFEKFEDFDVCTNILIDIDGERSTDWLTWEYPGIGQALVPYDKHTPYQYICGIYFVGKRDFLIENPQLENLRWNEAEDIEWSKIIREKVRLKFNSLSTIQFQKPKWKLSPEILENSEKLKTMLRD